MVDSDYIIIIAVILFVFFIALLWFKESYANKQQTGGNNSVKLVSDLAEQTGKVINAGVMAPLNLLAQGFDSALKVISSIPSDSIDISNDMIDSMSVPIDIVIGEFTSIYEKLNKMQGALLDNDQATSKIGIETLHAIENVRLAVDKIVANVATIVGKYDKDLKQFIADIATGFQSDITGNAQQVQNILGQLPSMSENITGNAQQVQNILGQLPSMTQDISSNLKGLTDLNNAIKRLQDTYSTIVNNYGTISKEVNTFNTTLSENTASLDNAKNAATNAANTLKAIQNDITNINKLVTTLSSDSGTLKNQFNSAINSITRNLGSTSSTLSNLKSISFTIPDGVPGLGGTKTASVTPPSTSFISNAIGELNKLKF